MCLFALSLVSAKKGKKETKGTENAEKDDYGIKALNLTDQNIVGITFFENDDCTGVWSPGYSPFN